MGRHTKGVAEFHAIMRLWTIRQHEFEEHAANLPDDEKRVLFRRWQARAAEADAAGRYVPGFPTYLRGLACGAMKKNGQRCAMTTLCANGRCKFHGDRKSVV